MNDNNLTKKTKQELIELFKEIKEQNNNLNVSINIRQDTINTLTEIIESKNKSIIEKEELIKSLNKQINNIVKYTIMFQIAIIVGALLMILFI